VPKNRRYCLYQNLDQSRPDAGQKIVADESRSAPDQLQLPPKHPKHQHVEEYVQKIVRVMQEEIGERLPDAKPRKNAGGHEAEPEKQFLMSKSTGENPNQHLQEKDRESCDDEPLDTRGDVKVEADSIALDARP